MATVITEECINCGACEPECPNTAIYQGGVEYDFGGTKHSAVSQEIFYIVPEKCTECVGFFDQEACAAVCPVDCCVPDPNRPESEEILIQRAHELHPGREFGTEFPSRFRPGSGPAVAEPAQETGVAAVAAGASGGTMGLSAATPATQAALVGRVERAVDRPKRALRAGDPSAAFDGEIEGEFDDVLARVRRPRETTGSRAAGWGLLLTMPLLGALDHETKKALENTYGDSRFFSAQLSTAVNVVHNFIVYPVLFYGAGLLSGMTPFTENDRGWIFLGVSVAVIETIVRLREGIFRAVPASRMRYGASLYGAPMGLLVGPLVRRFLGRYRGGWVPVEGFYSREFEPKRERERRYGEVYAVEEFEHGWYVRFELPREIPDSAARDDLGLGREMPDYDLSVGLSGGSLVVRGSVVDPALRAVCGVSPAFPADFRTEIALNGRPGGFRHRYTDKILEVAVLKHGA